MNKILTVIRKLTIKKRLIDEIFIKYFKEIIEETGNNFTLYQISVKHMSFFFFRSYAFPRKEEKVKTKCFRNPWITRILQKSSNKGKNFMIHISKTELLKTKKNNKEYKNILEVFRKF